MAGGFWTGLIQGSLLGAVALAGLSLVTPLPLGLNGPMAVNLPIGSEFGRSEDISPRLPEMGTAAPRPAAIDPVIAPAPQTETAPVAVTDNNTPPDALVADQLPGQPVPESAMTSPEVMLPQDGVQTVMPDIAPQLAVSGADALPSALGTPENAPILGAPALDLSLPPDLSNLRQQRQ